MIEYVCPSCSRLLRIPDEYAGNRGKCSHCGQRIVVPGSPAASSAHVPVGKPWEKWVPRMILALVGVVLCAFFCVLSRQSGTGTEHQDPSTEQNFQGPSREQKASEILVAEHVVGAESGVDGLQRENKLPRTHLEPKTSGELEDNRIGEVFPIDRQRYAAEGTDPGVERAIRLGQKWARISLDRFDLGQARAMGLYSEFNVTPFQDAAVERLVEHGITVLCCIVYWDKDVHGSGSSGPLWTEEVSQRYLDYARFIVRHFKGRIRHYEILNEPVNGILDAPSYIALIRRVIPVIRQEDTEAKIVVGGATDLMRDYSHDFFLAVVDSDVMARADGIALHPMYGASPQYDETRPYYYGYPDLIREIKAMSSGRGFKGELFAEEMCWRTFRNPHPEEPWQYTDPVAAKYYARGIVMHLGMGIRAGIGGEKYDEVPPVLAVVRNLCTVMAGNKAAQLPVEILGDVAPLRLYTFSLRNDEYLIALWRDSAAVDNDPGVRADIIVRRFAASKATGIDVLEGIEQELIVRSEAGDLVVPGLLVKDYPIILRVAKGH